jgi:hypothetical protein
MDGLKRQVCWLEGLRLGQRLEYVKSEKSASMAEVLVFTLNQTL